MSIIKLKKIGKKDLSILISWRNKEGIRDFNTQFMLLNLELQKKWFMHIKKNNEKEMFIIMYNDKPVGVCGLINIDKNNHNAQIAIIIGEEKNHGKGIGKSVMKKLLKIGFEKFNLHRISAEVFEFNNTSQKFFESLDFKYEYTEKDKLWRRGRWWNVLTYSILYNEYK
jgi:UDP-4-amino-4,6-dideoxy-N-acetyl-beta-L-altrosamine N-acetyltransferase